MKWPALMAFWFAVGCAASSGEEKGHEPDARAIDAGGNSDAGPRISPLEEVLTALRADREATLMTHSRQTGWPVRVEDGYLFVSTSASATSLAGDHNDWIPVAMTKESGFAWALAEVAEGDRYKFTDGADEWIADPWSRSYSFDEFGAISIARPVGAHLERHFAVAPVAGGLAPRTVRVWRPSEAPTHVLYAHDGQNLFDPAAAFGSWDLPASAPPGLMIVGVDNTEERFFEYTHVSDILSGTPVGGGGNAYADFVNGEIRSLINETYGEPERVGVMGSSLGGLISLHITDRHPDDYDFVASLSGTLDWGSIGPHTGETLIERYQVAGHRGFRIYIDSGGNANGCVDSDGDGIEDDDPTETDNYCVTRQMEATLVGLGYQYDVDFNHWWETDAAHNESAWAARVFRPMGYFMEL